MLQSMQELRQTERGAQLEVARVVQVASQAPATCRRVGDCNCRSRPAVVVIVLPSTAAAVLLLPHTHAQAASAPLLRGALLALVVALALTHIVTPIGHACHSEDGLNGYAVYRLAEHEAECDAHALQQIMHCQPTGR